MTQAAELREGAAREQPDVACWDGVSERSLAFALIPPATDCVEADLADRRGGRAACKASCRRLGLTVTTRSAYRHPVARAFVEAIATRLNFPRDLRERVETAVQESVMNAMLHGNLELGSGLRDSLEGLATSHELIEALLELPQVGCSTIRLDAIWNPTTLHVMIRDSGAGFKRTESRSPGPAQAEGDRGGGRGLAILEMFCDRVVLLCGGTTIKLGFRL
jgi:anti-sigma regulatory factor (Ser/Thr protein kinase)